MPRPIQTFQVGVKAFVARGEQLLLVRERARQQLWELPGGRIDEGELGLPLEQVLRRELREELGAAFCCTIGAMRCCWTRAGDADRRLPVLLIGFDCSEPAGEIELSDEHVAFRWVSRDEAAALPLAPGYAEAVAGWFAR